MLRVIRRSSLTRAEYALASFLQGSVNKRDGDKILIDVDIYLEYINEPYEYCDLWSLVEHYANGFNGLAVFDLKAGDVSINMAATVCAVENLLGVPRALLYKFKDSLSLPVLFDAADYTGSNAERQEQIFDLYSDRLDTSGLVHQVVVGEDFRLELRDFSIFKGYFCFFTDENDEDIAFRHRVLSWADRNIAIYGWTTNEISFLKDISTYGNYVIPMDWSANHSYFAPTDIDGVQMKQKISEPTELTPNKHYLAIVVSDGDNVQWLERDFATTSTFGQRLQSEKDYKMNWTISPSMTSLCPDVMQKLYNKGRNDYFISGVSGIGYTNLMSYPEEHMPNYARITDQAMKCADLHEICMLDSIEILSDEKSMRRRIDLISEQKEIRGAIWELDPHRYESGKGRVIFSSNGTPFLSVRISLWHPSNTRGNITREWLDGYVEKINSLPVSPNSIDGYTVLNVHPWTVTIADLDYLVSRLAPHIEIVYVKDMLDAIIDKLPHVDAQPEW